MGGRPEEPRRRYGRRLREEETFRGREGMERVGAIQSRDASLATPGFQGTRKGCRSALDRTEPGLSCGGAGEGNSLLPSLPQWLGGLTRSV